MPSILRRRRSALPSDEVVAQRAGNELCSRAPISNRGDWPCGTHATTLAVVVPLYGLRDRCAAQRPDGPAYARLRQLSCATTWTLCTRAKIDGNNNFGRNRVKSGRASPTLCQARPNSLGSHQGCVDVDGCSTLRSNSGRHPRAAEEILVPERAFANLPQTDCADFRWHCPVIGCPEGLPASTPSRAPLAGMRPQLSDPCDAKCFGEVLPDFLHCHGLVRYSACLRLLSVTFKPTFQAGGCQTGAPARVGTPPRAGRSRSIGSGGW